MPDSPLRRMFDRQLWLTVGNASLFIIRRRTLQGRYLNADADTQYSVTTLPVFGADKLGKGLQSKLQRLAKAGQKDPENAEAFYRTSKNGKLWLLLKGGYKRLRELANKPTDKVNLTFSGRTLRNLKVVVNSGTGAGFNIEASDPELAKIIRYHNDLGAGKSKKIRRLLGHTDKELNGIVKLLQRNIPNG